MKNLMLFMVMLAATNICCSQSAAGAATDNATKEMKTEHVVNQTVNIHAEPSEVWEALTNPELTKKYFYGTKVSSDWKVGHPISFRRKFLWKKIEMNGEIIKIEPNKLLKYTLHNSKTEKDGSSSTSTVTDKLSYENGVTTVSITDDVGTGEGAEKRYKRSVKGWNKILKGLKKTVEKENPH